METPPARSRHRAGDGALVLIGEVEVRRRCEFFRMAIAPMRPLKECANSACPTVLSPSGEGAATSTSVCDLRRSGPVAVSLQFGRQRTSATKIKALLWQGQVWWKP